MIKNMLLGLVVLASIFAPLRAQESRAPTLFAAASLKPALEDLAAHGVLGTPKPRLVFAASSTLAQQIEQGAPADVFISADEDWMNEVARHGDVVAATRRDLIGNALVLIAPKSSGARVDLTRPQSLVEALGADNLSVALTRSVPAGRYASQSLHNLGLWQAVADRLAMSRNVRAALELVAIGEAPLGIVYRSDAVSEPRVRVVATFPATSHEPIVYPVAIVKGRENAASRALLAALASPRAQQVFRQYGFDAPPR